MKSKRLWHSSWGNPSSPPLIFLHGFMGSHLDFLSVIESLSTDFFCIALDLPGHGHSKEILPESPIIFESLILEALENYPKKDLTLIGYSMGGRLAMSLSKKMKLKLLVLISAQINPLALKDTLLIKKRDEALAQTLVEDNYTLFLERWYSMALFRTLKNRASLYRKMIQERQDQAPKSLAHILMLLSPSTYQADPHFLETLKTPLLNLCGLEDKKYLKLSKEIHNKKDDAWIYTLSETSHALHLEDPLNTSQIIKQFHRYYHD